MRFCGWPARRSSAGHFPPARSGPRPRLVKAPPRVMQPRPGTPVGALPHLQVGLGAVVHVACQAAAAESLEVLEPLGVEAVVGDAFLAVVERPLARRLLVEGDAAVVALERVADGLVALDRGRLCGQAAEVGAVAPAELEGRAAGPVVAPLLHVVVGGRVAGPGDAAELPDPRPVARVHPAVRGDHAGVLARLEQGQRVVDRAWLMWSGLTIMSRFIIRLTRCRPSGVSPRVLQCGAGG